MEVMEKSFFATLQYFLLFFKLRNAGGADYFDFFGGGLKKIFGTESHPSLVRTCAPKICKKKKERGKLDLS